VKNYDSLIQVGLSRQDELASGVRWYKTCLIDNRPDIKVGNSLTLKDDEVEGTIWTIDTISQPIPKSAVNRTWNNNI
jgi:hypothetical protein